MLATLTKQLILNERIVTTETRAKEVRKSFDKMVTYGKKGTLVSRRLALAFLHKSAINFIPEFEFAKPFVKNDADFRSLCSQGFAEAFFLNNR